VTSFGFSEGDTELVGAVGVALQSVDAAVRESRAVEVQDDDVGEGPSETGANGQDCPQNSHRDEEETENQKPLGHCQTS
jgi:hypothetical protein